MLDLTTNQHIHRKAVTFSEDGPTTVLIPGGASLLQARDIGGGSLTVLVADGAESFPAGEMLLDEAPVLPTGWATYSRTYIEFSSGSGLAVYHSLSDLGEIRLFPGLDIPTAQSTPRNNSD